MISKWYELKSKAIKMRMDGISIREIEKNLGIRRSTLSDWFKNIKLTTNQKTKLNQNLQFALIKARNKAIIWHNKQKEIRIIEAHNGAIKTLENINVNDNSILELAFAMLYLGEGSKSNITSIGNSNPLILKFFIKSINLLYKIDKSNIRCELHLRSDQDGPKMIEYWSKELNVPNTQFTSINDRRIAKSKTYSEYKGVCVIRCGKVAILRKVVHLAEEFSKITITRQ